MSYSQSKYSKYQQPHKSRNNVYWFPTDDELDFDEDDETTEEFEVNKNITKQEAYEENKGRTKCILCGKKTVEKILFTSVIRYCSCIEKLS